MDIRIFKTDQDYQDYSEGFQRSGELAYIQESGDIYFTTSCISGELETFHCSGDIDIVKKQDLSCSSFSFKLKKSRFLETSCTHENGVYPGGTEIKILISPKDGYEFTGLADESGKIFSYSEETIFTLNKDLELKETYGKRKN